MSGASPPVLNITNPPSSSRVRKIGSSHHCLLHQRKSHNSRSSGTLGAAASRRKRGCTELLGTLLRKEMAGPGSNMGSSRDEVKLFSASIHSGEIQPYIDGGHVTGLREIHPLCGG